MPEAKSRANMKSQIRLLEELGLVRGSVLSTIRQLRNEMMHGPWADTIGSPSESAPEEVPDREKCLLYHDMVWYFLRSTEHLARRQVISYFLSEDPIRNPDPITIDIAPANWETTVSECNIHADLVSYDERRSWILVLVGSLDPKESYENWYCYLIPGKDSVRLMGYVDTSWILEFAKKSFTAV